VPFVEDLTAPFADFGVDGTLNGVAVRVIFDRPTANPLDMTTPMPQATLPTAAVTDAVVGQTLVLPAGTFTVRERADDGTGISTLMLTEA
jgi:hypothetical protein